MVDGGLKKNASFRKLVELIKSRLYRDDWHQTYIVFRKSKRQAEIIRKEGNARSVSVCPSSVWSGNYFVIYMIIVMLESVEVNGLVLSEETL